MFYIIGYARPRLPPVAQIINESRIAHGEATEQRRRHPAVLQKAVNTIEEGTGHALAFPNESSQIGNILLLSIFLLV